jgi:HsdM N-terminal domain.
MTPNNFREKVNFICQVADHILRGAFKAHEHGDVTLPFVVLRRLDLALEPKRMLSSSSLSNSRPPFCSTGG